MAETGAGVRSSRHWKAAANIEFYYNEIQKGSIRCVSWIGKQLEQETSSRSFQICRKV